MVANVEEILRIVRSNPFIDGIGYFVEVTTSKPVAQAGLKTLNHQMRETFCAHAQASLEGEDVLGLDFHEHIFTQGEGAEQDLEGLERILKTIEQKYGVEHLCIEFQFDLGRARKAKKEIDELLKP